MIGVEAAARAQPDGYTLLVSSTGPTTISPLLTKGGKFKPLERLEPIRAARQRPSNSARTKWLPAKRDWSAIETEMMRLT
jgi:tripartite-type tricarboxylate transporter receptor subunit TctC